MTKTLKILLTIFVLLSMAAIFYLFRLSSLYKQDMKIASMSCGKIRPEDGYERVNCRGNAPCALPPDLTIPDSWQTLSQASKIDVPTEWRDVNIRLPQDWTADFNADNTLIVYPANCEEWQLGQTQNNIDPRFEFKIAQNLKDLLDEIFKNENIENLFQFDQTLRQDKYREVGYISAGSYGMGVTEDSEYTTSGGIMLEVKKVFDEDCYRENYAKLDSGSGFVKVSSVCQNPYLGTTDFSLKYFSYPFKTLK